MPVKRRKAADVKQTIDAWSYSRLSNYETCPLLAKFLYIVKLPQDTSPAMERGSKIHGQAEGYIKGETLKLPDTKVWFPWIEDMAGLKAAGYEAEKNIAFDSSWQPCEYFGPQTWIRLRVDATGFSAPDESGVPETIDYKTGRPYPTHEEQAELYGIATYLTAPNRATMELSDKVRVSFWYLDVPDIVEYEYIVDDIAKLIEKWTARATVMLTDTEFKPNPCKASCGKYGGCDFAANKGGQCLYTTTGVLKAGGKSGGEKPAPPQPKLSRFNRGTK